MKNCLLVVILMSSLATWPEKVVAIENDLPLEQPREVDSDYQSDRAEYTRIIRQLQHILAVRANQKVRQKLLGVNINIVNRGRAEIFALDDVIYVDMALLDLLQRYADELSVAHAKNDPLLQLEFNLSYAVALNGNKRLRYLDPYNTAVLSDEQKQLLWKAKLRAEKVIFENTLGFMIAHEMSHLLLNHNAVIRKMFPDENARKDNNPAWVRTRREIELTADELGSRICLNALLQPAQLLPWLDLNEIRRRYYGKAAEYPTSAQRIAIIENVYDEIIGEQVLKGDLREFAPLAPHKDVLQGDYHLHLDEFRRVRSFGQNFLVSIDKTITKLLEQNIALKEIAEYVAYYIAAHKELLTRSENPETVNKLIELVSNIEPDKPLDAPLFVSILDETGVSDSARELILQEISYDPVDMQALLTYLELLKTDRTQYDFGLKYDYLLANTYFRWHPELFAELIAALPAEETKARELIPYVIGEPIVREPPTYAEKLYLLRIWDGRYLDPDKGPNSGGSIPN
jgi:hypothetical protein